MNDIKTTKQRNEMSYRDHVLANAKQVEDKKNLKKLGVNGKYSWHKRGKAIVKAIKHKWNGYNLKGFTGTG